MVQLSSAGAVLVVCVLRGKHVLIHEVNKALLQVPTRRRKRKVQSFYIGGVIECRLGGSLLWLVM